MRRHRFLWIAVFTGILLLSLDFWRWGEEVRLGAWGFPSWMGWFVGLQALLVLALGLLATVGWDRVFEDPEGEDEA